MLGKPKFSKALKKVNNDKCWFLCTGLQYLSIADVPLPRYDEIAYIGL